jgi:hypothetical protein
VVSTSVGTRLPISQFSTPERASEGHGGAGPLENYANSSSPPPSARLSRARRYRRRSLLWGLSSLPRVRKCGRVTRSPGGLVEVRRGPGGAGLGGLCTCGSVWACPVCNAKVMARRALELGCAVASWHAGGPERPPGVSLFGTLTLRHRVDEPLAKLWEGLTKAWGDVTSGAPWLRQKERLGLGGWVRAIEVNHGVNGWHVHIHTLLLASAAVGEDQAADFAGWLAARWSRAVVKQGLSAPLAVGQDLRLVRDVRDGDLAAYVTKQTDLGLELTQSQSKRARSAHSTVPVWDLLTQVETTGDLDVLDLWHEYERASKGKAQMTWSHGLKRSLSIVEATDEEVAAEEIGDETILFIQPEGWAYLVAHSELIPRVLDAADHSPALLRELLDAHGVTYLVSEDDSDEQGTAQGTRTGSAPGGVPGRDVLRGRARAAQLEEQQQAGWRGDPEGDADARDGSGGRRPSVPVVRRGAAWSSRSRQ